MASTRKNITTTLLILLFVCFLSFSTSTFASSDLPNTLFAKGYVSMFIILETALNRLLSSASSNTTTFTIFAPTEEAFLNLFPKYPDAPYSLLQYHIVPSKLDRESLETSRSSGRKIIDTLFPGYPIVVTMLPHHETSINNVKIVEWDVYNDGRVIVHGVEEFFDPSIEILRYPGHAIDPASVMEKNSRRNNYDFKAEKGTVLRLLDWLPLLNWF